MIVPKITNTATMTKTCLICGRHFTTTKKAQLYCGDEECNKKREELRKKALIDHENPNLFIKKGEFANRTVLRIQCHAISPTTGRCNEHFNVVYQEDRTAYPKYCHKHTNAYQRKNFEGAHDVSNEHLGDKQQNC